MPWNDVNDAPAPLDRVIEVTSGAAWCYEDAHRDKDHRHRPNTTWRHWKYQGGVALVIWNADVELGRRPVRKGAWIDTQSGGIFHDFRFWREYENPLAGNNGLITSTRPPFPINQEFAGDARLRLYDQIEKAIVKQIEWAESVIARDVAEGRQPNPASLRSKATYESNLERTRAERADAYDPHELPVDVRGTSK